ncbi:MAG: UDP-2,4-diacetamido-2,4,6-trideoxy-beta-L-altropyranose hydrolase [Salibacteraceae bacterium]|jgi:UDP-2,4-diacetamido-2,4,6-trideoxy-beta-L-altropyranose hydrolase
MMEVFILANGSAKIGMGHVFRSLTLVKYLKIMGVKSTYLSFDNDVLANLEIEKYAKLINLENASDLLNSPQIIIDVITRLASPEKKGLLYIDSDIREFYNAGFQKAVVMSGIKLMYATLYNQYHYYAHILLNQNILALSQEYTTEGYTKKLLGPKYFIWSQKAQEMVPQKQIDLGQQVNLFVNFGNADPNNLTAKAVELITYSLEAFNKVIVVVGNLYLHSEALKKQVSSIPGNKIELHQNVTDMYSLMGKCNLGFSSMGLTFWELTYLNIPSFVFSGSDRERPVCEFVGAKGYAFRMGDFADYNWLEVWSKKWNDVLLEKKYSTLKTMELKQMVNINGTKLVANEMAAIWN